MKRKQVVDTLLQGKVNQQLLSFVFFIALLFVFTPTTAHAATFLVDSIIDAGDAIPGDGICASNVPFSQKCTVRAAIMEANASVGSDTIIVPVGTYVLRLAGQNEDDSATGDLDVLDELTIIGANGDPNADPSLTKIQAGDGPGQGVERVIAINPKMEKAFNATLRSLTIRYGTHSAVNSWDKGGGGVYWEASDNGGNAGSLTISNCVISDNTTSDGDGGGIALFNSSGSAIAMATIDKTVVKNNQANGVGGGIFIGMNTPINLLNSEVSTNRSNDTSLFRGDGGGIYIANNTLAANANIKNSTISNNRAENSSGKGGGIYTLGPLRLENSALYGNASTSEAGGIYANVADGQEFILENVTVSGNTAELNGGGLVFAPSASIKYRLTNVTVAENYGKITGGGIYLHNSANSLVLWNSIVSKNTRENGVFDNISAGSVDGSSSNNLIGSGGSGGLVNGFNGNQVGVDDPKLGPLADNGGGTKTHALLPGSLAIDAGSNTAASLLATDQRGAGFLRKIDSGDADSIATVDIGAFEAAGSSNANLTGVTISSGTVTQTDPLTYTANVSYAVDSITVTPTVDITASVTVQSQSVNSGTPSLSIPLTQGATTPISIVVTAEDGTVKNYTLHVTRAAISTNADLSNLVLSAGTWDSPFSSGDTDYTVNVGYEIENVTVTATVADSNATITVNGADVSPGVASSNISLTAGANTPITVVVTAQSGATKTYTMNVNRAAASTNADLSSLVLSAGTWDSPFSPGDTDYAVNVGYGVEKVTVTPTVADSTATITVNGNPVGTGTASGDISLTAGANTPITVVVTAQSGATKTYTINVNRAAASTNADLSSLVLSAGTWDSPFSPGDTDYAVNVGYGVEKVTVTPTVADSTATITVNGNPVGTGAASGDISLTAGANTPITVVVTAQSGATKTFTINVNRAAASTNVDLSNLVLSAGTWDSPFSSGDTDYAVNVGYGVENITVTATVADSNATITVNGADVSPGVASSNISLTAGANTPITVVVTAQSGATKTYTINVNRAAASTNADLSNLVLSAGTWDSPFSSGDTDYAVNVGYGVENITVTATVADSNATITVNGADVSPGVASSNISLTAGANTPITVVVTAQSGATKTYTINVNRAAASTNADLSNLVLSAGTWDSPFSSSDTDYAVNVGYGVDKVTVTPTVADSTATITVNGNPVGTGAASGDISLTAGANTPITVVVTAQSGATKTYTMNVNRAAASTNVDLSNLVLSAGTWDSPFSSGDTDYAVNVGYGVENITVTATVADSNATITVNGNPVGTGAASGDISLTAGANTPITVVVTTQSGATKTYTINVNRAAASTNVDLSNLVLSAGTWDSPFSSGDTDYDVNVGYEVEKVTVTPTVADSTATITVNGNPVGTGAASGDISLTAGANTPITVVVTAQSGATKTYTMNVNRAAASTNADLSNLVLSAGTWDSPFSSGDTDYDVNVGYEIENVTVTATVADSNATITVNGADVSPGVASSNISLTAGANTPITVVVTAQSGATKTYTINVNRAAASTNADLSNLVLSAGTWDSPFSSGDTDYDVNVGYGVENITVTATVADSNATITVNGADVSPGVVSSNISLTAGDTKTITVEVTAQSGYTKTYTLSVTRAAVSTNADLSNLVLSEGALSPTFSPSTTSYTASVPNSTASITLRPTSSESHASIKVNNQSVTSGTHSGAIHLTVGDNPIAVAVTAQDTITTKTYTVTVKRAAPNFPPPIPTIPVTGVSLHTSSLVLKEKSEPAVLLATIAPTNATNQQVIWGSSNPTVVAVDQNGRVTPLQAGEAIITVTTVDGKKVDTCRVVVIPALVSLETSQNSFLLKPTKSQRFKVYAVNSDGKRLNVTSSKKTTYEVKPSDLASVVAGNITAGKNEGDAVLTIRYEGQTIELPIHITNESVKKVTLSENNLVMEPNEAKEIEATAIFGDGTERVVTKEATWTSNNPEIAQVTNGEIVARSTGTAKVTVAYGGKKTELIVKVEEAKKVKRLTVDARSFTISKDKSKQVTITATYEDGTKKDVTGLVEWTVSNPKVASVEEGLIMGQTKGKTTITAMYQNKKVVLSVTVK